MPEEAKHGNSTQGDADPLLRVESLQEGQVSRYLAENRSNVTHSESVSNNDSSSSDRAIRI